MFRIFSFRVGAAGAALFASGAIAGADAVNSVKFADGKVLEIQGIYGSGSNVAYEVVQFNPTTTYAWEYRWNPAINVDGWTMLSAISSLTVDASFFGPPFNEHFINSFSSNGVTTSGYSSLSFGSFSPADVSAGNPQGTTWSGSGYNGIDQLILTSDPSTVTPGFQALANGSMIGWGTYSADFSTIPPGLPETAAPISIAAAATVTASTDAALGNPIAGISFDGGKLAVTNSFSTPRQISISATGGTVQLSGGVNFGVGGAHLLSWAGGLSVSGSGVVTIAQTGRVSVTPGSSLQIAPGSIVIINGSSDPFTDSFSPANHVAIANDGSLYLHAPATIAGITGSGNTIVGDGVSPSFLKLAPASGISSMASLQIQNNAQLDITNNTVNIAYTGASPMPAIHDYLVGGRIISSLADSHHGVGYGDTGTKVQFRYTFFGDENLDGSVNFADLVTLAQHYNSTTATWTTGDFNNDGTTNFADLVALAQNYNASLSGPQASELPPAFAADWNLARSEIAAVPEPASLGMITAAASMLLLRRRRSLTNS